MDKIERGKLQKEGFIILRSQWDNRKGYWKIVKYNGSGWERFGMGWYTLQELCWDRINIIVKENLIYKADL